MSKTHVLNAVFANRSVLENIVDPRCLRIDVGSKTPVDFSQNFASAAEVARNLRGDCTEHAVLLAALCRARGIPARAAMGLVYMPRRAAFGYHMWTEAWIDGAWIPLDATLGRGGIGAAHVKMTHTSLDGASPYEAMLPILQAMGQLKIEIAEVEE